MRERERVREGAGDGEGGRERREDTICVHLKLRSPMGVMAKRTRQSEMANTSPRHMPVLGNIHPSKIENVDIFS